MRSNVNDADWAIFSSSLKMSLMRSVSVARKAYVDVVPVVGMDKETLSSTPYRFPDPAGKENCCKMFLFSWVFAVIFMIPGLNLLGLPVACLGMFYLYTESTSIPGKLVKVKIVNMDGQVCAHASRIISATKSPVCSARRALPADSLLSSPPCSTRGSVRRRCVGRSQEECAAATSGSSIRCWGCC
eukprot:SAG22_NODE_842_length_6892_cov_10.369645_2_plen_186_part_00